MARFLVVGVANTLVTGAIFYALSLVIPTSIAYTIAFALGVVFAVTVTPRFVFVVRPPARRRVAYAAWYLIVYAVGLMLVRLLEDVIGASEAEIVVASVSTTAVLGFLGGRAILTGDGMRGRR